MQSLPDDGRFARPLLAVSLIGLLDLLGKWDLASLARRVTGDDVEVELHRETALKSG